LPASVRSLLKLISQRLNGFIATDQRTLNAWRITWSEQRIGNALSHGYKRRRMTVVVEDREMFVDS
jgi:hypothetical protein